MKNDLLVQKSPKSPIAEVFRTLRTNIQFMNSQKELKTLLVTSTMPGEGKTWVSSNLAITFAQAGKKVALVDADMRKGNLSSLFKTQSVPGLSNYLSNIGANGKSEEVDIAKCIKTTEIDNLFLIPSGNIPPNPSELLTSERTADLLNKLKEFFDIVILDGTPSLIVTDALVLARVVDSTLIVVSHNTTKKNNLEKIKKDIENIGGKIAGVVLNKVPINAGKYGKSYYYGSNTSIATTKLKTKKKHEDIQFETSKEISQEKSEEIMSQLNDYLNNNRS